MKRSLGVLVFLLLSVATSLGLAQGTDLPLSFSNISVRAIEWPQAGTAGPSFSMIQSTSELLRFDRRIVRVAVSNPEICDITTIGDQDVLVVSKKAGIANLLVWDPADQVATFTIHSTVDVERLRQVLENVDETANLRVVPFNDTAAIYGEAETSLKLKQIIEAAKAFQEKSVSFLELKESKQILLEVRFAEVSRKATKELKVDAESTSRFSFLKAIAGKTGESVRERNDDDEHSYGAQGSVVQYPLGSLGTESVADLYMTYFSKSIGLQGFIKWLEQKNAIKFIARPNLVTKDGEEANFVVGGEYPIPLATRDGITISYKEYGTQLKFLPEILDKGLIRLKVNSEVSELDFSNTLVLAGATIPAVTKRTHQTVAELKDNETLLIGGLITQKVTRVDRKVPFLGDLPFLSVLFNGHEFSRTDVELLIIVTPHIVRPFSLGEQKTFFDEKKIKQAVRIYEPSYKDAQADTIGGLMAQGETRRNLSAKEPSQEEVKRFANSFAEEIRKERAAIKPRTTYKTKQTKPPPLIPLNRKGSSAKGFR